MDNTELILAAIEGVHREVTEVKTNLKETLDDHEERIRGAEKSILKFRTLGIALSSVVSYFGWDYIRLHLKP